jgi:sec-independent protein translocase protein TatA
MNTPLFAMFGLGTPEIVIISILVLVLFGAKKLPMFARSVGKSMGEFKKARQEFEHEMQRAQDEVERPALDSTRSAANTVSRQRDHQEA